MPNFYAFFGKRNRSQKLKPTKTARVKNWSSSYEKVALRHWTLRSTFFMPQLSTVLNCIRLSTFFYFQCTRTDWTNFLSHPWRLKEILLCEFRLVRSVHYLACLFLPYCHDRAAGRRRPGTPPRPHLSSEPNRQHRRCATSCTTCSS